VFKTLELPPVEELREVFEYRDGALYWRVHRGLRREIGKMAGCKDPSSGYIRVRYKYRQYLAHRIIWAICNGYPPSLIDHINGDTYDNRIENLREATVSSNQCNQKIRRTSVSGIKGVSWSSKSRKWVGQVWHQKRLYSAGFFDSKEECAAAVRKLREELHGEFARHE